MKTENPHVGGEHDVCAGVEGMRVLRQAALAERTYKRCRREVTTRELNALSCESAVVAYKPFSAVKFAKLADRQLAIQSAVIACDLPEVPKQMRLTNERKNLSFYNALEVRLVVSRPLSVSNTSRYILYSINDFTSDFHCERLL